MEEARRQSEVERLSTEREKSGVFTGAYAVNRLNGDRVPIYVADYVLLTYGTGIVMGVPAHDQRDYEFARKYGLDVRVVIAPPGWDGAELAEAFVEDGAQVNSGPFDGLPASEGKERIADHVEANGWGSRTVSYRLRDWLISRQRYWGTPIPRALLRRLRRGARARKTSCPCCCRRTRSSGPRASRRYATTRGSCTRHAPGATLPPHARRTRWTRSSIRPGITCDTPAPTTTAAHSDPEAAGHWLPVDQYTGGAEHAVMHLLYSRFFNKALRDLGLVKFDEPYLRLFNQGIIIADHQKMSKSRGNVITPDPYVRDLGADVVRTYLMFLGPWGPGRRLVGLRHQRHGALDQPRVGHRAEGRLGARRAARG